MKSSVLSALFLFAAVSLGIKAADIDTSQGQVKMVHFWEGIPGVLIVHDDMQKASCSSEGRYVLLSSHPNYKEIYSLLLAAHMSKRNNIRITISGEDGDCASGYPRIRHVYSNN